MHVCIYHKSKKKLLNCLHISLGFGSEASQIAEKKALVFKASIDVMLVSNISNRCTSDFVNCLLMEVRNGL
jgi:hypothetical protein